MKTEVYSWRVASELKMDLEREARRQGSSVSAVLDSAARAWLERINAGSSDEEEQARLREAALKFAGAFEGNNPRRSTAPRQVIRERLRKRHGR